MSNLNSLRHDLSKRQMSMIALGGVIGAGLFVGSGSAIGQAGPASVIAYAAVGLLVVLVMRMLAELAVAKPESGSFASYARREIGPWAGLAVGWCYAYLWIIVVGFEAVAGAGILNRMVPGIPAWLAALAFMLLLTAANLTTVKAFGEIEFWFAVIKVAVIIAFLCLGIVALLGLMPGVASPGFENVSGAGGFAPNGWGQVALASLVVLFSYFGTETVSIAAGEAREPAKAVRAALRTVVFRILIFYIGSIAVIVLLLPTTSTSVTQTPFAATLDHLGIPSAATVMDVVVITAVLSCLNSGMYAGSRMLFSLARAGEAPAVLGRVNRFGVPRNAVIVASLGGFVMVVFNYFLPTATLFNFLLESTGAMALVIYLAIAVSHLLGRTRADRAGVELPLRMWLFPWATFVVIAVLAAVGVALLFYGPTQRSFLLSGSVALLAVAAGGLSQRSARRASVSSDATRRHVTSGEGNVG